MTSLDIGTSEPHYLLPLHSDRMGRSSTGVGEGDSGLPARSLQQVPASSPGALLPNKGSEQEQQSFTTPT